MERAEAGGGGGAEARAFADRAEGGGGGGAEARALAELEGGGGGEEALERAEEAGAGGAEGVFTVGIPPCDSVGALAAPIRVWVCLGRGLLFGPPASSSDESRGWRSSMPTSIVFCRFSSLAMRR